MNWSKDNVDVLRQLIADGKSKQDVADYFGVNVPTIYSACWRFDVATDSPSLTKEHTHTDCMPNPWDVPSGVRKLVPALFGKWQPPHKTDARHNNKGQIFKG